MITAPIREIAPPRPSALRFHPDERVWHLGLEHIEADTGRLTERIEAPASQAGASTLVFDEGNILYSKLRPYLNKVICPDRPGIATTELVPIRPRPERVDKRYLCYYLRSPLFVSFISGQVSGAKMPRVNMERFWTHEVPLPPLPEQKRIASVLDKADASRWKCAEALRLTDEFLQSVFFDMFGDPVRNLKGWPLKTGEEIFSSLQYGTSVKCHDTRTSRSLPVLRIPNVASGEINTKDMKYATLSQREVESLILQPDDILLVRSNGNPEYIARCAIYTGNSPMLFASYLIRARIAEDSGCQPQFIKGILSFPSYRGKLIRETRTTAGNYNISTAGLKRLIFICPDVDAQTKFVAIVQKQRELITKLRQQQKQMKDQFDALSQRAFRGAL